MKTKLFLLIVLFQSTYLLRAQIYFDGQLKPDSAELMTHERYLVLEFTPFRKFFLHRQSPDFFPPTISQMRAEKE